MRIKVAICNTTLQSNIRAPSRAYRNRTCIRGHRFIRTRRAPHSVFDRRALTLRFESPAICEGETFGEICELFRDGCEATLSAHIDVLIFWRFLPCAERQFLADSLISAQAWPERRNYAVTTAKRSPARIHMTNYLDDDVPIEAPCPKCGHPQRIPIGRIRSATETGACPSCHVEIDNRDLAAALEQVNQDIEVLMRDLHIQRMLFAGREGNSPRIEARPGANGAKGA